MAETQTRTANTTNPLRLWPGVVAVSLQWLGWYFIPLVAPDFIPFGMMGGLVFWLAIIVWWSFFSRAKGSDRWAVPLLMIVSLAGTVPLLHESIATAMMGFMYPVFAIPSLSLVFVCWAVMRDRIPDPVRRKTMAAAIVMPCLAWTLLRTGGFTMESHHELAWRWSETPEERLLSEREETPAGTAAISQEADVEWPGFRGPDRNNVIHGTTIATDWSAAPPVELWRHPIGPGWSSFAVQGAFIYTQEQRGEDEVVACYNLTSGKPVWKHSDPARFWEANAGAGPRATPTLNDGRIYTLGATGILNVLDAATGKAVWSRNAATDAQVAVPDWAFAGSPLVVGDLVIVAVEGVLAAYDIATGEPSWFGKNGGYGYSSPHFMTIDGIDQILLMSQSGAVSVRPNDGQILWEHAWPSSDGIVQPARLADGDLLIGGSMSSGMRRIGVTTTADGWSTEERWTSRGLKPYFSDFVVHKGHAYGVDGSILSCIGLSDGERKWKGGRYGSGQMLLLADQDALLVLGEQGQLALVSAKPDRFAELAQISALEGKTWNHPVLIDDILLVRNDREMAAYQLVSK